MRLRDLFEQSRQYLYHGTTLINALWIMRHGRLDGSSDSYGKPDGVSTSRSYAMAKKFSDYNGSNAEPYPVIFVIDWDQLHRKGIKTEPFNWDPDHENGLPSDKEMEEVVHGHVPLDFVASINIRPDDLQTAFADVEWHTDWMSAEFGGTEDLQRAVQMLAKDPRLNKIIPRGAR